MGGGSRCEVVGTGEDVSMNPEVHYRLWQLENYLNKKLDKIHDEALQRFRTLARRVGQRTRTDRATK